jgi:hypothetical protein
MHIKKASSTKQSENEGDEKSPSQKSYQDRTDRYKISRRPTMATRTDMRGFDGIVNLTTDDQRCLHARTGRAPEHKMCANNHECGNCPFDQMIDDMNLAEQSAPKPEKKVVLAA